jgi:hypothetical protein
VPDNEVLGNQSDTNTDKTRALVQGCRYLDVFWPASQVPLEESAWVDSCTTNIIEELGEDKFVIGVENNPSATCVVCSENRVCIRSICSCTINNGAGVMVCHDCFFPNLAISDLSCPNSEQCEKLLPHEIIIRAKEGGVFESVAKTIEEGPRLSAVEENQRIDRALLFASEGPKRYLTKLVEALNTNEDAFSIVACSEKNCPFQALAEKNCVSVPCYFHKKCLMCVQCAGKWETHHQCVENRIFKNIAERREAKSMPCPNLACKVETQRDGGCMHMTCSQCQHHWCWYCVFHFYELGEHENKTQAYSTEAEYKRSHCQPFHYGAVFLSSNVYSQYCNLGEGCACRTPNF